ncbi:oxygen-dependent coproporphyrinogen oxidase [bacterium]|nr:oxygen-dependent coproporphyrinogen oxidase [bacterium]
MAEPTPKDVEAWLAEFQARLCTQFERFEPEQGFLHDEWQRAEGGGGVTAVLSDGVVFERAGVARSVIRGTRLPPSATQRNPQLAGRPWKAMGVSVVVHPRNPHAPTAHLNVRLFSTDDDEPIWWFGGGFDLTPIYGYTEDCVHWHQTAHELCAPFGEQVYADYKRACDEYFYLPHRGEARGIGGIFYDDQNAWGFARCFGFMQAVGQGFIDGLLPIIERRKDTEHGEREREFQLYRRGRYVEFNLVHDRGTLFGLQSGGRTESILMSMPPRVAWSYRREDPQDTPEGRLLGDFLPARDWLPDSD